MAKADREDADSSGRHGIWNRHSRSSRRCRNPNCRNEHVDPTFARTMGTEDGIVFACPECTRWAALKRGAAADPTIDHRVDRDWR
ncbi:hypothetical protein BG842_01520 [Haladaptatus sp. W1]|uniref:DUF7563 family protein n=1 Tax=Haladaptatus sp. W1 TaxID=1897478 RepID=UPI0008499EB5|nr:hypothetical protein [Haladaptatus sp. W1]ODR81790.1 hypothetical protein BG842_01520 [Haladaptatus sp. W1]